MGSSVTPHSYGKTVGCGGVIFILSRTVMDKSYPDYLSSGFDRDRRVDNTSVSWKRRTQKKNSSEHETIQQHRHCTSELLAVKNAAKSKQQRSNLARALTQ